MSYLLEIIAFVIIPYLALVIFVSGIAYRVSQWLRSRELTGLRTVAVVPYTFTPIDVIKDLFKRVFAFYTLPKMEKDRVLIVGTMMFHYGIWFSLLGHLAMVIPMGISLQLHDIIALYMGGGAGLVAFAGLLILTARRAAQHKMRLISYLDDYFAISILLVLIVLGLTQTFYIRPDFMATVSPWLVSILTFSPEVSSMSQISPVTTAHILVSLIFIAYIPFGKMVHIISSIFQPTITKSSFKVETKESFGAGNNLPLVGNGDGNNGQ